MLKSPKVAHSLVGGSTRFPPREITYQKGAEMFVVLFGRESCTLSSGEGLQLKEKGMVYSKGLVSLNPIITSRKGRR